MDTELLPKYSTDHYYDILADVYEQNGYRHPAITNVQSAHIGPTYDETDWYGLIEYAGLEDVFLCAEYLSKRDNIPTVVSGIFGDIPYMTPYCLTRQGPSIFHKYTVTHLGTIYPTNLYQSTREGYIHPKLIIEPVCGDNGYFVFNLPVSGYGLISIRAHDLIGQTFWPGPNKRYYHLNGNRYDNHFQNIGVLHVIAKGAV